jgi:DnaK suppressor protein
MEQQRMTTPQLALTPAQMDELRAELQRSLTRIERSLKNNGNGRPAEIDQSAVGRLSRIEAIQNQGLTQNLHERERLQLDEVADALQRLETGCYGRCSVCGLPIRFERLLVFPETRTCSACSGGN